MPSGNISLSSSAKLLDIKDECLEVLPKKGFTNRFGIFHALSIYVDTLQYFWWVDLLEEKKCTEMKTIL